MTDQAAEARAHEVFDPIAARMLTREGVDIGPMFGRQGLRIRGKVFALVDYAGELMLKVPQARADELVTGSATRVSMRGSEMREWITVPIAAADAWEPLVGEAYAFVDSITP